MIAINQNKHYTNNINYANKINYVNKINYAKSNSNENNVKLVKVSNKNKKRDINNQHTCRLIHIKKPANDIKTTQKYLKLFKIEGENLFPFQ